MTSTVVKWLGAHIVPDLKQLEICCRGGYATANVGLTSIYEGDNNSFQLYQNIYKRLHVKTTIQISVLHKNYGE